MNGTSSLWQWAGLHVSGALLVLFVSVHIVAVHYAGNVMEEGYSFESVTARMRGPVYPILNLILLVLALVHGLVGTHRFITDLRICGAKSIRLVGIVLAGAFVWGLVYGLWIFRAFTG